MKALTIWQPWATLIVDGLKRFEFRKYPAPKALIGKYIVIHAAKRKPTDFDLAHTMAWPSHTTGNPAADRHVIDMLRPIERGVETLPLAAGLGTARLGEPRRAVDIFRGQMDPSDIDDDMWGWPMTDAEAWPAPVPARGYQGFWDWSPLGPETMPDPPADLFATINKGDLAP